MTTDEIRRKMKTVKRVVENIQPEDFLSTGSTLLNLACGGGFYKGGYVLLVGDSDSGKTWITMTCLAEAARNPNFDEYRFVRDIPEGSVMPIRKNFGNAVADRLERPPRGTSRYVEDLYHNLDKLYESGDSFIYILDSMDALPSIKDAAKTKKTRAAADAGEETTGNYGTERAKVNSNGLRNAAVELAKTGSILIVICQTRDAIGFGAQYNPKTRSGGRALKFYARLELWTACAGQINKPIKGKNRQLGIYSQIKVKKNHVDGHKHLITLPIFNEAPGLDEVGSCVDYLIEEGRWKKAKVANKTVIKAPEFDFAGGREALIRHIEDTDGEDELRMLVTTVWKQIAEACKPKRKARYV